MIFSKIFKSVVGFYLFFGFLNSALSAVPLVSMNIMMVTEVSNKKVIVYNVVNNSQKTHAIEFKTIEGAAITSDCSSLMGGGSCKLTVSIDRDEFRAKGLESVRVSPIACLNGNSFMCYQSSAANTLNITVADFSAQGGGGQSSGEKDSQNAFKSVYQNFLNLMSELMDKSVDSSSDQQDLNDLVLMANEVATLIQNNELSRAQDLMKDINELMNPQVNDCGSFCM